MTLKKFLELQEDENASFNLGRCLVKENEILESAKYFSKAIELNQN